MSSTPSAALAERLRRYVSAVFHLELKTAGMLVDNGTLPAHLASLATQPPASETRVWLALARLTAPMYWTSEKHALECPAHPLAPSRTAPRRLEDGLAFVEDAGVHVHALLLHYAVIPVAAARAVAPDSHAFSSSGPGAATSRAAALRFLHALVQSLDLLQKRSAGVVVELNSAAVVRACVAYAHADNAVPDKAWVQGFSAFVQVLVTAAESVPGVAVPVNGALLNVFLDALDRTDDEGSAHTRDCIMCAPLLTLRWQSAGVGYSPINAHASIC
jgi:hypothetical protein